MPENPTPLPPTRGLGAGMIVVGWLAAIAMIAFLFNGWLQRQNNPNSDPDTIVVDGAPVVRLLANRQGHYLATGKINGVEADFLLDTGATSVAIPGSIAARFGVRGGQAIQMETANGKAVGYTTTLESVQLGGIVRRNVSAIIAPDFPGQEILLGMSFLRHLKMEQNRKQLTLRAYK